MEPRRCSAALAAIAALLLPVAGWSAPPAASQVFTVLGLRTPDGRPVADLTERVRKALGQQVAAGADAVIRSEDETKASLGVPVARTQVLIHRIGDAESDYQQFALESARTKFEAGLQDLASVGGEDGVWESTVTAHLLLGLVHLAGQGRDAASKARSEFEAILRVHPSFQPAGHSDDPIVLALFEKARAKVSREPTGQLAVSCSSPCPEGFVWVDAAPSGRVNGAPIKLPAGSYRVRITDRQDAPRLRSFSHEVQLTNGGEARLLIDLDSEGALDLAGGPAFVTPADADRRLRVVQLAARRVRRGKLALVWHDTQYVHLAIVDCATAKVERHAAVVAPPDGRLDVPSLELARFAVGGGPPPLTVVPLAPLLEASPPPPAAPSDGIRPLAIAKWSALGATVALGIAGGAVAIAANSGRNRLNEQVASWGGGVPPAHESQYLADTDAVVNKEHWRNGLLIGGAVCAVGAVVLFVVDAHNGDATPRPPDATPPGGGPPKASELKPASPGAAALTLRWVPMGFAVNF
jgi:hypothetical protein